MPNTEVHLRQANHNEAFFDAIKPDLYSDWAVTVLFYSALQYVDAYLAKLGHLDPGTHEARDGFVRQYQPIREVSREYFRLKNYSVNARYYAARFSPVNVRGLHLGDFETIKARMMAELP